MDKALKEAYRKAFEGNNWVVTTKQLLVSPPMTALGLQTSSVSRDLNALVKEGVVVKDGNSCLWTKEHRTPEQGVVMEFMKSPTYLDHGGVFQSLDMFYDERTPTIIIGPHGTGKTEAIKEFARMKGLNIYTVPCSLGLREHHFIGRLDKKAGDIVFKKGPVPRSMEDSNGAILYLDELNAAEADVLLRMDEVLDGRKEVSFEGETIKADPKWWCVASINPLDHAGTKELPNQLMSRFTARIHLGYPSDVGIESAVVERALAFSFVKLKNEENAIIQSLIGAIRDMRDMDLPYAPSLRESISASKMIIKGVPLKVVVKHILVAPYYQWGTSSVGKVKDYLTSKFGSENVEGA